MHHEAEAAPLNRSLSRRVLAAYHGRVLPLVDYLIDISNRTACSSREVNINKDIEIQPDVHRYLLNDADPLSYRDLLANSLVAGPAAKRDLTPISVNLKICSSSLSMIEVIDKAHARLFAKTRKPSNVITAGYRTGELRSETGKGGVGGGRQGVTNFFVNTMVTALQAPEWLLLLKRVGDAIILHLLTETCIYVALPNDCYCQITGTPIIYSAPPSSMFESVSSGRMSGLTKPARVQSRKRKAMHVDEGKSVRPEKRLRVATSLSSLSIQTSKIPTNLKARTASTIPIARVSMFYARPRKFEKSEVIALGLSPDHILNRMESKNWRISKGLLEEDGNPKDDLRPADCNGALEARHLSKYVFPKQYGLNNVFNVHPERLREEQFTRFRFVNREDEIKSKGNCKTPGRLKNVLPLLESLRRRHGKCGYKALLNTMCPSKLRPNLMDATADSSVILELISEESSSELLQSQMSLTMSGPSLSTFRPDGRGVSSRGALNSTSQMTHKPKFAEFACSFAEVYMYICAVTRKVIPRALWGCEKNQRKVLHHAKQIVVGRRHEGINLHFLMQGISTSECDWLMPPGKPSHRLNQSESEMLKRRELLEEFIFWYFEQFLLPLLRTTFYITDSSAYRNRVLYFRQDDWDILCQPLLDRMAATTFQRINQDEAEELLRHRTLGYSFVRLLPKESGVRPIVNLRRKRKTNPDNPYDPGRSINQILSGAFHILGYEKKMQSEKLGASVFGPDETYRLLTNFKKKIIDQAGKMSKLYFVKVDVQACFDTIEQGKLLGILKELITEDVYMVQKYGKIYPSSGTVQREFVRNAMPDYEHPHFLTYAAQLASLLRHAILVDQVVYPFAFRDEIVQLLEDHITSNIVKIGKDYYRQRVGIPQGSVLSSLLCSFFYGDLEHNVLNFIGDAARPNVLLRLIDDYLFITTDVKDARLFLEVMNQGHPEYGCFIAREKTLTNFEHHVGDISQHNLSTVMHPDRKLFPWCGYLINTEDLSITADYSRFHKINLTDSLTVERSRRPNTSFMQKMIQASKAKTHPIYTDTTHNSSQAVIMNIYQAFVLAAMKMHGYVRAASAGGISGLAFVPGSSSSTIFPDSEEGERPKKRGVKARKKARGSGAFLLKTIRQSIRYTYASIRNRASGKLAQQSSGLCNLSKDEVLWLGMHAFHSVLSIKRTTYAQAGVLSALNAKLVHTRLVKVKRRLVGVAKKGLEDMLRDVRF